ncbi:MAG: TolC family protein [Bacteroides sp.]|nr:TolC family protein [Bacteroides sp.]
MKTRWRPTLILCLLLGNPLLTQAMEPVGKQPPLQLTLSDALEIALSENLTVRIAGEEIRRQEYARKGTYADLFPQIDFVGDYQYAIRKQTMYMDLGDAGDAEEESGSGGIQVGRDHTWSAGFSATVPVVSASLWKSLKISGYDVELAVEKARSSRIEMRYQVKQAFYSVLFAGESVKVFREAYDNALRNYQDIEAKFEQGLESEYDLIRADVNVKNAEPDLYHAENSLELAHWRLKALMGIDLERPIECIGSFAEYETDLYGNFLATDTLLNDNSDLRQLDIQYNQLKKTKEIQIAEYYPTLNASFSYLWNAMANDLRFGNYRWDPYAFVGVSLKVPIFSGGKRYSNVKQTRIGIRQMEWQRDETQRNLRLTVKQYHDEMNTSIKQYHAARKGVEQAEKGYYISVKRYDTGDGTLLEINDSQLSLTNARLNLNQSVYNFLIARAELEKTLGSEPTL